MNCKLCFQSYKLQDPRKLPRVLTQCGHTFCDQCIKLNLNFQNQLVCKDCGKINYPLSSDSFPLNQTLIAILRQNEQGICGFIKESQVCKAHGKKLQAFCENDQMSVCLNCILAEHKSHKVISISEKVEKQKQTLRNCQQSIAKSQQLLIKKEEECQSLIDKLQLDLNEYVFQINLLYKNIINQIKESEETFISQNKKTIDKSIKEIKVTQEAVREKKQFYEQLMNLCEDLKSKSGVQFINQSNKRLFIVENSVLKQRYTLNYKKQEIQRDKVLTETIKSLQQLLQFERKKAGVSNDKKSSISQINSQGQNLSQNKNAQKNQKSGNKDDSFSKSINQSPCRIQKKSVSSIQKLTKQPQILQVNLMEKYQKHVQAKNMKKRNSQIIVTAKGKSPKIEYEVKRQVDLIDKNAKYNSSDSFRQKAPLNNAENDFLNENKICTNSGKSLTCSKFQPNKSEQFALSFLNESCFVNSPDKFRVQNQTFDIETPLSIKSFMESSQFTMIHQRKDDTLLKDSRTSFTMFCTQQKVFHFGGLKNGSISCHKITPKNNELQISNQVCAQGFFRSKCQCVIMKNYHPKKCLIMGGKDANGQRSSLIYSYHFQNNKLQKAPFELNQAISGFGAVVNDNKLYVFGGSSYSALKTLHEYKIVKGLFEVKKLSPMINSRDQLGFALGFDGFLYVGGGVNSSNIILNSCERYCFKSNKWTSIAAMKNPRRSFTLVSLPNGLYAMGGHDGKSYLKSVQMYDFDLQSWVQISSMGQARSTHTAICTNDYQHIIVFGGFQGQPLKTVEVYNIIENKWFFINQMQSERYLHCSIVAQE